MKEKSIIAYVITGVFLVVLAGCGGGGGGGGGGSTPGTTTDNDAPVFGGLMSATAVGAFTVNLGWTAAADNVSGAGAIQYNAYYATTAGAQNFVTPDATATGGTSILLTGLSASTNYYVVVRAEDEAGNEDTNTMEIMVTTGPEPTLSGNVQPIFNASCATTGCHTGGVPAGGLDLSTGNSFGQLVGVDVAGCAGSEIRVTASDSSASELVKKLTSGRCAGSQMPVGGTLSDADIQTIVDWIDAGALNN